MDGMFDYLQAVLLLTFAGLFIGRTIYARRVLKAPPITFSLRDRRNVLTVSFFVAMTVWFTLALIRALYPAVLFPPAVNTALFDSLATRIGGLAVIVLGLAGYVVAIVTLGQSWRVGDLRRRSQLVTHGIYSVSRNPIYFFMILFFFGVLLMDGTPMFLIFAVLLTLNAHYLIIEEEAWLAGHYGDAFQDYRAATGRYLTRPTKRGRAKRGVLPS
jgi:protein-S-isoprenylcysteine O-methyltransferase Ste14